MARALAIALADSALRMRVLEHLRDSPFPKHALHATRYLGGRRGASLLARVAKATGQSPADLLRSVRALDGFALSAPYTATRALWTGDAASVVVVGSGLTRDERYRAGQVTGYKLGTGEPVRVSTTESSSWFVLAVYPSEDATAFGGDPEGTAARAPQQRRLTISTPEMEMTGGTEAVSPAGLPAPSSLGSGVVQPNVCLPDDAGCTPRPTPTPPPPAPQGYAPSEVGGWDWGACTYAYGSTDRDQDRLHDECEYQLAYAFRPYLSVAENDRNLGREPYYAVSLAPRWFEQGVPVIQLVYALSYHHDNGDPDTFASTAHHGDSEFILVQVQYLDGRWVLLQVFTSAHWNAERGESSRTSQYYEMEYPNGRARTRPLVYVSRDKHGNYNTRAGCNSGGFLGADDCVYNRFVLGSPTYEVEVLRGANIGNKYAPGGPRAADGTTYSKIGVQLYDQVLTRQQYGEVGSREYFWQIDPAFSFCGWEIAQRPPAGYNLKPDCAGPYNRTFQYLYM